MSLLDIRPVYLSSHDKTFMVIKLFTLGRKTYQIFQLNFDYIRIIKDEEWVGLIYKFVALKERKVSI